MNVSYNLQLNVQEQESFSVCSLDCFYSFLCTFFSCHKFFFFDRVLSQVFNIVNNH
jgi:hypothetical protein